MSCFDDFFIHTFHGNRSVGSMLVFANAFPIFQPVVPFHLQCLLDVWNSINACTCISMLIAEPSLYVFSLSCYLPWFLQDLPPSSFQVSYIQSSITVPSGRPFFISPSNALLNFSCRNFFTGSLQSLVGGVNQVCRQSRHIEVRMPFPFVFHTRFQSNGRSSPFPGRSNSFTTWSDHIFPPYKIQVNRICTLA